MDFFRTSFRKRPGKRDVQVYDEPNIISDIENGEFREHHCQTADMMHVRRSSVQLCDSRRSKLKTDFLASLRQKLHRKDTQSRRRCGESHLGISLNASSKNSCRPDDKTHVSGQTSKKHSSKSRVICPLPSPIMCSRRCSSNEDSGSSSGPPFRISDERQISCNLEIEDDSGHSNVGAYSPQSVVSSNGSNKSVPLIFNPADESLDALETSTTTTLSREIFRLSHYGWYWGPISRSEAEERLMDQCDGAFLVRDSSDDRYLLSLSFRSFGKTLHTRIDYCNGLFSFYHQKDGDGKSSVVELIDHSMSCSLSGVFCYSRSRNPGSPSFPVRLTKPISRFTHVRSLQYLCRFVIRRYTRFDHIQNLPLPQRIKGYIEEGCY